MKQGESGLLKQALGAWRTDAAMPCDFQSGVWSRIRRREELRAGRWLWIAEAVDWLLGDVRLAGVFPALALAAGFLLGLWHDRVDGRTPDREVHVAYVDSLDPYVLAARLREGP